MNFLGIIVSYLYIGLVIIGAKIFEKRGKEQGFCYCGKLCGRKVCGLFYPEYSCAKARTKSKDQRNCG